MTAATAVVTPSATDAQPTSWRVTGIAYWSLTKPDVNVLILVASAAGFYLGALTGAGDFAAWSLVHMLIATLLVASGAAALNQFLERHFDARMHRTARRPLASGRLDPFGALSFGVTLVVAGAVYATAALNVQASALAVVSAAIYLALYTPLKRRTPLCTLVGAVAGAMPPLIGWAAASGRLAPNAWVLFAVLFLWQLPHFMAIAWLYRRDYARAGFRVLPPGRRGRSWMTWQAIVPAAALLLLTVGQAVVAGSAGIYVVAYLLLGVDFVRHALGLARERSNASARRLLLGSIVHLPVLLLLMAAEKTWPAWSVLP